MAEPLSIPDAAVQAALDAYFGNDERCGWSPAIQATMRVSLEAALPLLIDDAAIELAATGLLSSMAGTDYDVAGSPNAGWYRKRAEAVLRAALTSNGEQAS